MTFDDLCEEKNVQPGTKEFDVARLFWNEVINNLSRELPPTESNKRTRQELFRMRSYDKVDYEK